MKHEGRRASGRCLKGRTKEGKAKWGKLFSLSLYVLLLVFHLSLLNSCSRMGRPDGGWYDETPPRVVATSPTDGQTGVTARKVSIYFDENIKLDNPSEKVVVSPPQMEQPEIKSSGKCISVALLDSLKPNTTYTIDFSDAISDNNEGNPMGNYTYTFSTGEAIDTLQVGGYVLDAQSLEPVKGILVGLYKVEAAEADSVAGDPFLGQPLLRVARTDSHGHFSIKGVAAGAYRVYALQDQDGNYYYSQKSEAMAFHGDIVVPSAKPDVRQDTLWRDSLHISDICRVGYTHFLPDDLVLRAFTVPQTDRYLLKTERPQAECFSIYFTYGSDTLPQLRGLNFNADEALLVETNSRRDTINYWLRDTMLVNQDTLQVELRYMATDTLGTLAWQTDTLELLSRQPVAKRMKARQKAVEDWEKQQEKLKKRGQPYDSIMPVDPLRYDLSLPSLLAPDQNIPFKFPVPLASYDVSKIHLYAKGDSVWYKVPFEFVPLTGDSLRAADAASLRSYVLRGEWRPSVEYSLEIDSAAFVSLYGLASVKSKNGFKVASLDDYGTLLVSIGSMAGQPLVVQLLDGQDKPLKEVRTSNGQAEFFYLKPGQYYMRMIVDDNENGRWDTGDYATGLQPERVYYYPSAIECRAKWDVTENWNPTARPLNQQKPAAITQQKADKEKRIYQRNAARARKMGIEYIPK